MPEPRYPGVYVEEIGRGTRTIEGADTATLGLVGATGSGPVAQPTPVASLAEYAAAFGGPASAPTALAAALFFANGGRRAVVVRAGEAAESAPDALVRALEALTPAPPPLLLLPDAAHLPEAGHAAVAAAATEWCAAHGAFHLLDAPADGAPPGDLRAAIAWAARHEALRHGFAAVYHPWLAVADPARPGATIATAPGGAVAGLLARTDAERGVWHAPAGLEATVRGAAGLTASPGEREAGLLQAAGINAIRALPGHGLLAWGARTFLPAGDTGPWRYVAVRRTAAFIEASLERGLAWAAFEPNAEPLWAQVRLSASSFMNRLFRAGGLQGRHAGEAYFVRCGRDTMTAADLDAGRLVAVVGFALIKPAEFVIVRIGHCTAR